MVAKPNREPDYNDGSLFFWWEERKVCDIYDNLCQLNPVDLTFYSKFAKSWRPLYLKDERKTREAYLVWLMEKELLDGDT